MALSKIVAKFQTTLAAECLDSDTTFTLSSVVDGTGNNISGVYCFVIDEGTDYEEYILGSVNPTTKVVSSLTRGLDYSNPTVSVNALKKDHYRGAIVKITNFSILEEIRRVLTGTDTIESPLKYETYAAPTENTELVSKKYVDDSIVISTGDVTGPSSATDEHIAVFDGITGKLIKDGGSTIAEIIAGALSKASTSDINVGTNDEKYITPLGLANSDYKKESEILAYRLDEFATPNDTTDLNATTTYHGLLPKLSGTTTEFLRADGTWVTPTGSGDVTGPASSETNNLASFGDTTGKTLVDSGYTVAEIIAEIPDVATGAEVNTGTNNTKYLTPLAISDSNYKTLTEIQAIKLDDFATPDDNTDLNATTSYHGLLRKLNGSTTQFLRGDGSWATPESDGDVVGPASATNLNIVVFDSTTGKLIKDGGSTIAEIEAGIPNKASYTEINTGTNDTKFTTPLGLDSSNYVKKTGTFEANNVAIFSDTTGKEIEDGGKTITELLARANHTGTQTASTISDFDTEVSNNTDVAANTTHRTSTGADHTYIDQSVVSGATPIFTGTNFTGIPTSGIDMLQIGSPTYTTLRHWINTFSAGFITAGTITSNGNGTCTVGTGTGLIKTTDSDIGELRFFDWAEDVNVSLINNATNWLYVDYNGGSPIVAVTTDVTSLNLHTQIVFGRVYRTDNTLDILNGLGQDVDDYMTEACYKDLEVYGFQRASGMITTEDSTRYLDVTAGVGYCAHNRYTCGAKNTNIGGDTFTYVYRANGGGFTFDDNGGAGYTQVSNILYDDGDGTPGNVDNNKYATYYVYQTFGNCELFVQMGQTQNNTLAEAQEETVPTPPDKLRDFALLIAKIIIEKGATNFTSITNPFNTVFMPATPVNHNDLGGIQGGSADSYYHLTGTQHTDLTDAGDSALHYHSTDRARANHTGTQPASTISDFDTEVANNTAVTANTAKETNATHTGEVTGSGALTIADNVVDEANLKLDEAPTNDYVLTADSTKSGGMKWAAPAAGFEDPMTTRGDIIIRGAGGTTRLGIGTNGQILTSDGIDISWGAAPATGASTALDNLASVAINTSLISDTNNTDDIGSTGIRWKKGWFTDMEITNLPTIGGSTLASQIKLDDLATPDDNTDLDVSTSVHGLCPKAPNIATQFLRGDGTWAVPIGGPTYWEIINSPTRSDNDTFTCTTTANTDINNLVEKGTVVRWEEGGTQKVAVVESTSYSSPTLTVNIKGDTMASIDSSTLEYSLLKAERFTWAVAGSIAATGTNVANSNFAIGKYRALAFQFWAGAAGSGTTIIDVNDDGTSLTSTKASITTTNTKSTMVASTSTIAEDSVLTIDIDAVASTPITDMYCYLFVIPNSLLYKD